MKRVVVILALELTLAVFAAWTFTRVAEGAAVPSYETTVEVTAYCLQGRTASGAWVSQGVIAGGSAYYIGQRVYIPGYGLGTILDRGLLGYTQLDLWVPSCWDAFTVWGRQRRTVWILG